MTRRWATLSLVLVVAGTARAAEPTAAEPASPPPAVPAAPAPVAETPALVSVARAPEPEARPSGGVGAPLAGAVTAVAPFVVGCALWANSTRPDLERAGTYVMAAGFAAAPWVSHGLQGRWRRAAVFGALATATSAATLVAMDVKDPFNPQYVNRQRVPFGILLTSAMFTSIIGVFDSFLVSERP